MFFTGFLSLRKSVVSNTKQDSWSRLRCVFKGFCQYLVFGVVVCLVMCLEGLLEGGVLQ